MKRIRAISDLADIRLFVTISESANDLSHAKEILKDMPSMQLYDMYGDPGEQRNLVDVYPEKVKELKDLLLKYIDEGRSTPGAPQKNEAIDKWPQLEVLRSL